MNFDFKKIILGLFSWLVITNVFSSTAFHPMPLNNPGIIKVMDLLNESTDSYIHSVADKNIVIVEVIADGNLSIDLGKTSIDHSLSTLFIIDSRISFTSISLKVEGNGNTRSYDLNSNNLDIKLTSNTKVYLELDAIKTNKLAI